MQIVYLILYVESHTTTKKLSNNLETYLSAYTNPSLIHSTLYALKDRSNLIASIYIYFYIFFSKS